MLPKYHLSMGHDVTVIASLESFDIKGNPCLLDRGSEYISDDGYKVIRLDYSSRSKTLNRIFKKYKGIYEAIEKVNPDIIFIHGCQSVDIRRVLRYVRKHEKIRIYVDNHADFLNSGTNWISKNILHKIIWRYYAGLINPYTEKFYGVTPLRCSFLKDVYGLPADKTELLVMGADDEKLDLKDKTEIRSRLRQLHGISENNFVIISGGKIERRKNIHLLIQALKEINNDNIRLILFGTSNNEMKPVIDDLSMSDRVINIGWIEPSGIYDYFLACDLAVFPGSHSVLWEQSAGTGIPCIYRHWEGMEHVDVGGNCRFLYSDTTDEIKKVIEEITGNSLLYQNMKKAAEEKGRKIFSYREIAKKAIQEI